MPDYHSIAARKQQHLESLIPPEWRLAASQIPAGMLSVADSVTNPSYSESINVVDIPRTCGLLTPHELHITEDYDIRSLLTELHSKRLTAEEVTRAFCKRAAIAQQLSRCLSEPLFTQALARARTLDAHLRTTNTPIGPLHGLPISVKDTFHITGVDATNGLAALAFHPSTKDADLVTLLQSLGAIIITKTNVPQTVSTLDTANNLFGRTLNPLNRRLTVGGSTGGEAALLALRGTTLSFGTDIGGSVRIPPMCVGKYGFKPSHGRLPYGGQQESGHLPAKNRIALQPVAGVMGHSVEDIGLALREIVPRAELFGEDCIPGNWGPSSSSSSSLSPAKQKQKLTIGILRTDGLVEPLPPIRNILNEVATILHHHDIDLIDLPTPPALRKCQAIANKLMGVDGGNLMHDLLEQTNEPLIPWLQGRSKRRNPLTVPELCELQHQRAQVQREMMSMWTYTSPTDNQGNERMKRRIDAIIHPVAPHPVPEHDKYNAVGYTSSWVLLDYPAGVVPVRKVKMEDLEVGREMKDPVRGSWDAKNRELWDEKLVDRRIYLDSPLSVQVITPRLHDYELVVAMGVVDRAVKEHYSKSQDTAKL
ncbi:general amidase [Aspergillus eucalypticola CBS 122712]|uniref:General amidase n=1 Tax=Aspergillus eucalypticola (strain CBS 122712 / IBT 29274) TaxID=1448314 RepID=A0A317WFT5_ASPEC|nr:general amidase [Aspergillus eucalypticola CBS 122712]PWY84102.1 general amidase [Aspergillus eucalypticola CBS 122712]